MQKITIVSDVHIGSVYSKWKKFYNLLATLETDLLILNGDLYDLYVDSPKLDVFYIIENNTKIKEVKYIRGNHDYNIKEFIPDREILNEYVVGDVLITHGHQFDFLVNVDGKNAGWITRIRNWVEKKFNFNVKIFILKIMGPLVKFLLFKANKKAAKKYPDKKVIIGHTHIPICKHPYYNCGGFVDNICCYMNVYLDGSESIIELVEVD